MHYKHEPREICNYDRNVSVFLVYLKEEGDISLSFFLGYRELLHMCMSAIFGWKRDISLSDSIDCVLCTVVRYRDVPDI